MVQIASDRDIKHMPCKLPPLLNLSRQRPNKSNGQVEISKNQPPNYYWVSVANQENRETKEASDEIHADVVHCSQLQIKGWGSRLEQRVDEVIRRREQKTKANKPHIFDDHEQTVWTNHEGQNSPVSHGHNVNYNHMTLHNRGVHLSHSNPGGNDDSTLTPNGSNSISGDSHGLSLYSCWVCGMEGNLLWYCSKTVGVNQNHIHCIPHMTHACSFPWYP